MRDLLAGAIKIVFLVLLIAALTTFLDVAFADTGSPEVMDLPREDVTAGVPVDSEPDGEGSPAARAVLLGAAVVIGGVGFGGLAWAVALACQREDRNG